MTSNRPKQEVSLARPKVQESRSEPTLSPKFQVYVEAREKAAATRAAQVVEKAQRTDESELDQEAILDNMDNPEIDSEGEREQSEGEIQSDDNQASVMDTHPPATALKRFPEIDER